MNFFRAVRIVLCDTIVVDTQPLHNCPQNVQQQEGPSPPKAGDGLWGIGVTCQCRSIHCDEWTARAGGEDREAVHRPRHSYTRNLCTFLILL